MPFYKEVTKTGLYANIDGISTEDLATNEQTIENVTTFGSELSKATLAERNKSNGKSKGTQDHDR